MFCLVKNKNLQTIRNNIYNCINLYKSFAHFNFPNFSIEFCFMLPNFALANELDILPRHQVHVLTVVQSPWNCWSARVTMHLKFGPFLNFNGRPVWTMDRDDTGRCRKWWNFKTSLFEVPLRGLLSGLEWSFKTKGQQSIFVNSEELNCSMLL
jgi:hypothetical protein